MGGMTPSVSTLQRLTPSMHKRWESIAPETPGAMCSAEDIPLDTVRASVSLDGVMVALRAGEDGRADVCFRKHRHRMRYHPFKEKGIAIGSGVLEAANKTLVTQPMKSSGMRWRIPGGQAVLTFRAPIKSGIFDRAWAALMGAQSRPANDNISPTQILQTAA